MRRSNKKDKSKDINLNQAQVTIELTLSMVAVLILLVGVVRLFVWFNDTLIRRERAYERSLLGNFPSSGDGLGHVLSNPTQNLDLIKGD